MRTATEASPAPAGWAPPAVPLALLGPTASGKTEASIALARALDAEIVVVDSMTVYRGMDVGTAKPTPEERRAVPHHMLDVADPDERYSVARFQRDARHAVMEIAACGRTPLLVGGSGLYFRGVVDDLDFPGTDPALRGALEAEGRALGPAFLHRRLAETDPAAARRIDPENLRRTVRALEVAALTGLPFSAFAVAWEAYPADRVVAAGIRLPPDVLRSRIEARVDRMLEGGLLEEVRGLMDRGFEAFLTASQAIGYLEVVRHVRHGLSLDEARSEIVRRTKALARRQMAWFRRDRRIRWFEGGRDGAAGVVGEVENYLRAERRGVKPRPAAKTNGERR